MSWWQALLAAHVADLRLVVLVLVVANLCWLVPLSIASLVRGKVRSFPNAEMALPVASILCGVLGFQHGYLVEGVAAAPAHWRDAVNLLFIAVGLLLLALFRLIRTLDELAVWRAERARIDALASRGDEP